ncbi:hypothetical protein [Marmoricola sp. RAF53]|uniref:hypothetical protein n=1 Tax=Marmoricola sp. RAF53 TaxID=3233059 RepID=UPI003F95CE7B
MAVERTELVRETVRSSEEYRRVKQLSDDLFAHLLTPAAGALIAQANMPGTSSAHVQATFEPFATRLGFSSEKKGLFDGYPNKALRPDYFLPIEGNGILLEVERGKTTTNNMDLLDLWKCHICEHADYLFLLVPQELRHNPTMSPKREYMAVVKRLGSFFMDGNYTNVKAAHIFGY